MIAVKMAERKVGHKKNEGVAEAPTGVPRSAAVDPADPIAQAGFDVSPITIEKTKGSSLIYAIGTLSNSSDRQRFGVKLQFDLFDDTGQKVGTAKDYQSVIEPKAEWKFRALVVTSKATSAKIASVTEEK
jgi:hypothetical protein